MSSIYQENISQSYPSSLTWSLPRSGEPYFEDTCGCHNSWQQLSFFSPLAGKISPLQHRRAVWKQKAMLEATKADFTERHTLTHTHTI